MEHNDTEYDVPCNGINPIRKSKNNIYGIWEYKKNQSKIIWAEL